MTSVLASLELRDLVDLLDEICRRRAVTRDEVCGRARTKAISQARHEVWWRLRHPEASFSFEEIGRLFRRNHATVIHGVRAHQRRADTLA
jgi:chromosomal replication initiation ATPase DnaA